MVEFIEFMENKGNLIVRDLIRRGCTRWEIMNRFREKANRPKLAWNSVKAWERGQFCNPLNIPYLEQIRYEWCIENKKDMFEQV